MTRKEIIRFLLGGLFGLGFMLGGAFALEWIAGAFRGTFHFPVLVTHSAQKLFGSYSLAVLVQSLLCFGLGGMAGLATLPFAEDGKELILRSLAHFICTAVLFSLLMLLCVGISLRYLPNWLGVLLAVYLVIWLGRYVGWFWELLELRDSLGLSPGPSPLNWKETLPYLPFLAGLCLALPAVAAVLDPPDVPIFSQFLVPALLLPTGCFAAGMSLGKRRGLCPLYVGIVLLLSLPALALSGTYAYYLVQGLLPILTAILGHGLGVIKHRRRR